MTTTARSQLALAIGLGMGLVHSSAPALPAVQQGGAVTQSAQDYTSFCGVDTATLIDGLVVDDAFVDDVAAWEVLDWGTCSTHGYHRSAGRYFFTEASPGYATLRTFFMTADACSGEGCKSGYRFNIRYRADLSVDDTDKVIEGEMVAYFVTETPYFHGSSPLSARLAPTYVADTVYAGKVTFTAESHVFGDLAEPSYEFRAFDAGGVEIPISTNVFELIDLTVFCPTVAEDVEEEVEERVDGTMGTTGDQLVSMWQVVADATGAAETRTALDSATLIETTAPHAIEALDAVLRGHMAVWSCEEDPEVDTGGGLGTGPGTVQAP